MLKSNFRDPIDLCKLYLDNLNFGRRVVQSPQRGSISPIVARPRPHFLVPAGTEDVSEIEVMRIGATGFEPVTSCTPSDSRALPLFDLNPFASLTCF